MKKISFSIHPLFFLVGIYFLCVGEIFTFLVCTITAVIHELGHSIVAGKLGYKLNKIVLMPFGAIVNGSLEGLNTLDQIKIAIAGPMVNIFVCLLFVSFWWLFPEVYAFTDLAVFSNLTMALVNLIPAYPLDGGRILYSVLLIYLKEQTAKKICKVFGLILGAILLIGFVCNLRNDVNVSLLLFSLFILVGVFDRKKESKYVKAINSLDGEKLKHGATIKRQALDITSTLKNMIRLLDGNCINEIVLFKDGKEERVLNQEKILFLVENNSIYSRICDII